MRCAAGCSVSCVTNTTKVAAFSEISLWRAPLVQKTVRFRATVRLAVEQ